MLSFEVVALSAGPQGSVRSCLPNMCNGDKAACGGSPLSQGLHVVRTQPRSDSFGGGFCQELAGGRCKGHRGQFRNIDCHWDLWGINLAHVACCRFASEGNIEMFSLVNVGHVVFITSFWSLCQALQAALRGLLPANCCLLY